MKSTTLILGLETSCDETAAAVVRRGPGGEGQLLSNVVHSQLQDHAPFGGVVPEIAARAHVQRLDGLIARALSDAAVRLDQLDAVAATAGPGLLGGLLVAMMEGKAIALARGIPFLAVNHLKGHALTPRLLGPVAFPYLLLLISGGHTQFQQVEGVPLHRYHLRLRLARALDLLPRCEDMSALAMDLGFSSHSHFAAAFKQMYGRTPSEFRACALAKGA